jgi:GNAT superfamily N-acetyltransferase
MRDDAPTFALPAGYRVRAPTFADLPAVFDLLMACDRAYLGTPDTAFEDLQEEWENLDLAQDAFLVLGPDDRPVGVATIDGLATLRADAQVHPACAHRSIGAHLRHLLEIRAWERAKAVPEAAPIRLETWISRRQEADRRLLQATGYEHAARYCRMRIDLAAPPPAPVWPAGISLRTAVPGEDEARVYAVLEDANRDDAQHELMDYARWRCLMVETYRYDPTLWWLAVAGEEIVAAALGVPFPDEGWIRLVGVRRGWRRRGIATALVRTLVGAFWHRGFARVELGVDPDSPFGAQRLYERVGMTVAFELDKYQKALGHRSG